MSLVVGVAGSGDKILGTRLHGTHVTYFFLDPSATGGIPTTIQVPAI